MRRQCEKYFRISKRLDVGLTVTISRLVAASSHRLWEAISIIMYLYYIVGYLRRPRLMLH
ncbi:hypothetical protein I7I50_11419 [Histoplasma capsulatum G186AR]|uniref:Uncharacterized protein n=1 Tax=Ajellomyces capsulatus TaxID=5037 RepID=A0A8H7Z5K8_AJECA|nr:hypothetical protein I7I52_02657 [Histoplasma capsulatum]QSS69955.1 hypothetical protein I7I50_11419 [Histoplasma capsulatum G186AR]